MRRMTARLGALVATALLAVTTQAGQAGAADEAAYFTMRDITRSDFVIKLTDPAKIREARDIVANQEHRIVVGRLVKRPAEYNPRWSFHYNPDTVQFVAAAIEVCDATTPYVEDHLDEAGGAFLPGLVWCPWTGRLTAEIPTP
ncbi:calmodulin-binding protein [Streptomyces sp. SID9124]|uniref:BP74-related protein n=1 Tax=Streptomyces sp. SID9124 TaxID=2706108 RepID=UPI0013E00A90|nr:calmodulin-binding protein [Streptomyces sp. SID9124]NED14123.1 calmodulin-binding protein [Streptomyces sp. SID9124]